MTGAPAVHDNLLEIDAVRKSFAGVQALRGVTFDVRRGEVHALVGENGAGKSTLMKILCGVYPTYEGEVRLDGKRLALHTPRDARNEGIAIIHQELNLVSDLTVAENIFLGREPRTRLGTLNRGRMEQETREILARLNTDLSPDLLVGSLRVGEQQLVEAAKALAPGARLLILDEPTSALSADEIEHLFTVIAALKREGVTLIYISHKFEEIFRISDRITVLRDGEFVTTLSTNETDTGELIRLMVGRNIQELFPEKDAPTIHGAPDEALRIERLGLSPREPGDKRRVLRDISFRLPKGEIVGVAGLMGSGRTELLETIFGVHGRHSVQGRVFVGNRERQFRSPGEAIRAGLAFVTEDRKGQSLILNQSVRENITLAALARFLQAGFVRFRTENEAVLESIRDLRIKVLGPDVLVETLSGGNQQKVALAKCLLLKPDVLLLDEPTRGIDLGAKAEIYALIRRLAAQGTAILLASSEMPEILGLCDRILVLSEGRLTADMTRAEATSERILTAATKQQAAFAVQRN
jgi:ABC-type sugar transport system ATPase subunit